jgi:hypothetical protein
VKNGGLSFRKLLASFFVLLEMNLFGEKGQADTSFVRQPYFFYMQLQCIRMASFLNRCPLAFC